jgi:hypothetical protein
MTIHWKIVSEGDVPVLLSTRDAQDLKVVCYIVGLEKIFLLFNWIDKLNLILEFDGGECFIKD